MSTRSDIYAHIPEEHMTMAQLTFRRNGRLHDLHAAKTSGVKPREEAVKAHQAYLKTQSLLAKKIASK